MHQSCRAFIRRKEYLEKLLKEICRQLTELPEGRLRVSNDMGKLHYYLVTKDGDSHGKYISHKESDLVGQLAQKDYLLRMQKKVTDELKDVNKYIAKHGINCPEKIYENLNDYRKKLVTPLAVSDSLFAKNWELEEYETNPYYPEEKVYSTKRDELVRSKSEVLLADMYDDLGIPYRYEAELILKNGKKRYPDFTLLKESTREIIYHEHLGLLDDDEYRHANMIKLDEYRKNGIYLGGNLIITYEAEGSYLNIKEIKQMIRCIFEK